MVQHPSPRSGMQRRGAIIGVVIVLLVLFGRGRTTLVTVAVPDRGHTTALNTDTINRIPTGQRSSVVRSTSVPRLLHRMTLQQRIGQLFMISFNGTQVTPALAAFIRRWQPGGFTIFSQNVTSPGQVKALTASLRATSRLPPLIAVDQEGGEVVRITRGVKVLPAEAYYGQLNNTARVYADTSTVARQLRALGLNMNLAPVLDVLTNPNSPIDSRSFGPNAAEDARLGAAAIRGYQHYGIAATAKHFIGLGATSVNAESSLPTVRLSPSQLKEQLVPFQAAVHAGVDALMVTQIDLPGLTPTGTPASLSHHIVTDLIRHQLGYRGVIMTDSLVMGAITSKFGLAQAAVRAVKAGNDIVLIASGGPIAGSIIERAIEAVTQAVQHSVITRTRLDASVQRILSLKQQLGLIR
jgi:beta-N-acetylhexosaminidase